MPCGNCQVRFLPVVKRRDAYAQSWCSAVLEKVKLLAPPPPPHLKVYLERAGVLVKTVSAGKSFDVEDALANYMALQGANDGRKVQIHHGVRSENVQTLAIG